MTNTYRAAILRSSDSQGTAVLTGPEHATLTDAALLAEAQRGSTGLTSASRWAIPRSGHRRLD